MRSYLGIGVALAITPLFHVPRQTHPKAPAYHPARYTCTTGSLGDQLCCVWQITYPGYGFGTWTDCVVVPKATSAIRYSARIVEGSMKRHYSQP